MSNGRPHSGILKQDQVDIPMIEPSHVYTFPSDVDGINIQVTWATKQQGIICDLDLNVLTYDERVSCVC